MNGPSLAWVTFLHAMRTQLKHLENSLVVIEGTVSAIALRPELRLYDVCIADVQLRPYTQTEPQYSIKPIHLDHLWLPTPSNVYKEGATIVGLGKVCYYTRANGSVDLGVDLIPAISIAESIESLGKRMRQDNPSKNVFGNYLLTKSYLQELERNITNSRVYSTSAKTTVQDHLNLVKQTLNKIQRDYQATITATFGKHTPKPGSVVFLNDSVGTGISRKVDPLGRLTA